LDGNGTGDSGLFESGNQLSSRCLFGRGQVLLANGWSDNFHERHHQPELLRLCDTFPNRSMRQMVYGRSSLQPSRCDQRQSPRGISTNGIWGGNLSIQELGTNFTLMATTEMVTSDLQTILAFTRPMTSRSRLQIRRSGPREEQSYLHRNGAEFRTSFLNGDLVDQHASVRYHERHGRSQPGYLLANECRYHLQSGDSGQPGFGQRDCDSVPTIAGKPLTNSVTVVRNEADPNPANNQAVSLSRPAWL